MPIDALSVLCAQLTRDLLAIAKFLFCPRWWVEQLTLGLHFDHSKECMKSEFKQLTDTDENYELFECRHCQ